MFCGFFLSMHTLGSCDIFISVGIWVFDVKTRIYCQGVKNLNRTPKNACPCEGECVIFVKFQEWRHIVSGLTRCLLWDILDCDSVRKWFTKKIPNKKMDAWIKRCGIYIKPTFSCNLSTEWYFWKTPLKTVISKFNRRANARRKTQENDNLVTGCIYK